MNAFMIDLSQNKERRFNDKVYHTMTDINDDMVEQRKNTVILKWCRKLEKTLVKLGWG